MNILRAYLSGDVRRYHTHADLARFGQTDADHQGRCVQLLFMFHTAPSVDLIRAVAFHDAGEIAVGDVRGPTMRAHVGLAAVVGEIEAEARIDMLGADPLHDLERDDLHWLTFVDSLEAYAFMMTRAPHERHGDGWPEARDKLCRQYGWLTGARDVALFKAFLADLDSRAFRRGLDGR